MEFEIKNLDFETLLKQIDNFLEDFHSLVEDNNVAFYRFERIAKALETIAQEMVAENEAK